MIICDLGCLIYTRSVNAFISTIVIQRKHSGFVDALYIPNENDLKRCVKEGVQEYFHAGSLHRYTVKKRNEWVEMRWQDC